MTLAMFNSDALSELLRAASGVNALSDPSAAQVMNTVYLCSLYKEEAREVRCRLLLVHDPPNEQDFDLIRFLNPVDLTISTLRRLAQATTDPDSCIIVDVSQSTPVILGLGTPTDVSVYLGALGKWRMPIEVASLGPGVVEVSAQGKTVRFVRDRYVIPTSWQTMSYAIPPESEGFLVERAVSPDAYGWIGYSKGRSVGLLEPELFSRHRDVLRSEAPSLARTALVGYLIELIESIQLLGSGGAVLMIPSITFSDPEMVMAGHEIARAHHRYRGELWNAGLLNIFDWLLHMRMARLGKIVAAKEAQSPKDWIMNTGLYGLGKAIRIQSIDANRVAQLTAVDGALVLNVLLSPIIFGAKFHNVDIRSLPESVQAAIAGNGMRHRSMAATVSAIQGSSGIVVSQDGDITVFANVGGTLCYHRDEERADVTPIPTCAHAQWPSARPAADWLTDILNES